MQFGSFPSLTSLSSFLFAKEFRQSDHLETKQRTSSVERFAGHVLSPIQLPVDGLLKNYHKPIMIVVTAVSAVASWTLFWYPEEVLHGVQFFVPRFEPWMVKLGSYTISQTMIMALATRCLARLNDDELMQKYLNHEIEAFHLGTREY